MKIIKVPNNKKIQTLTEKKNNLTQLPELNEGFFDDVEFEDEEDSHEVAMGAYEKIREENLVPEVKSWLQEYMVEDYEIKCTGHGIIVDVHNHLYLANQKLLNWPKTFQFGVIDGNCNVANNRFSSWEGFPEVIQGDCIATFNRIIDFENSPHVNGTMFAEKQRVKTKYPLTNENYLKFKNGELNERCTVIYVPTNEYAILTDIDNNKATILFEGGSLKNNIIKKVPTNDIEIIDGLQYLENLTTYLNARRNND